MKQIIQNLKDGKTVLIECPTPSIKKGHILIKTTRTLVSLGTERMLVEFGKASLLKKARQQPDKVHEVLNKMKTDGVISTIEAVNNKLNQPIPLGYCNVGKVIDVGEGVKSFKKGDRVASNGNHSEFVLIPENLATVIPSNVSDDEAAFTVIGSIGLQGIRLINPTFGETIVVIGLGLIGLITVQILKSSGCNVIGFDFDDNKVNIARSFGVEAICIKNSFNQVDYVKEYTNHVGADGVLITASNPSNDIISNAAQMSRKRGRIILVGVIGLDINRSDFYEKELTFQVSCSYGPGRYDSNYENDGNDYPVAFVRWTEKRNFDSILNALSTKKINVNPLISEKINFEDYMKLYGNINKSKSIATILKFDESSEKKINSSILISNKTYKSNKELLGIIGAGNFTAGTILPKLKKLNFQIKTIASSKGLSGTLLAKKFKIGTSTTDYKSVINDKNINTIIITTQHGSHSKFVSESLEKDKFVFVEKPLATTWEGLNKIQNSIKNSKGWVTVGFNRRFSQLSIKLKECLSPSPVNIVMTMNAGFIPLDSWVHDINSGGGRIIGEACHFIDLCTFFTGSKVSKVCMNSLGSNEKINTDNASIILRYKNGSNAVINYFSNGSKLYPKERIEVYQNNSTFVIDNWMKLKGFGINANAGSRFKQDKGHLNQFEKLYSHINNGLGPTISWSEILNTTKATLSSLDSLKQGKWITV